MNSKSPPRLLCRKGRGLRHFPSVFWRHPFSAMSFLVILFALLVIPPECFAGDFGFLPEQQLLLSGGEDSLTEYTGSVIPWFAAPLGDKADLYLSGGLSVIYDSAGEPGAKWKPLPEIYRFEFIYRPFPDMRLEAGRVPFRESLSCVASGLFDGLSAGLGFAGGRLSGGLFYTGLLYKKAAYIYMSAGDKRDFIDRDLYFASRRFLAGLNWEKTSIFDTSNNLSLSALCQFDLNGNDSRLHSQYLEAVLTLPLNAAFNTVSGAVIEVVELTGEGPYAAFLFSGEVQWLLPSAFTDMLTLSGRFSSGDWSKGLGVFIPVSAGAQGRVLRPTLQGIAFLEAAYIARLHRFLSAELSTAYYFRTDRTSYAAAGMDSASASPLLGAEIYGGLSWAPYSELLLSFGTGVFLPQTGRAFLTSAKPKYRLELAATISL